MTKYTVLKGINYPPGDTRAEPGDVLEGLSAPVVKALLAADAIAPYRDVKPADLPTTPTTTPDAPGEAQGGPED